MIVGRKVVNFRVIHVASDYRYLSGSKTFWKKSSHPAVSAYKAMTLKRAGLIGGGSLVEPMSSISDFQKLSMLFIGRRVR